jgi:hypothetical protein
MSQWTMEDVLRHNQKLGAKMPAHVAAKSKYRNVKTVVDGEKFDSKREAQYWAELRLREKANDITHLSRQVPFDLCCPTGPEESEVVAQYIADFVYKDRDGRDHIVDAKGKRTQMYALKKKWLELQSGIFIEEV